MMFERLQAPLLKQTVKSFPITVLTGPRQSGKTTLLRLSFPEYAYISLESPDQLMLAKKDPRGLLFTSQEGLIIDEAQNFPEIFSYIQEALDLKTSPRGQFPKIILSGSQNFLLSQKISQTLAGRAAILELLPLTYAEWCTKPHDQIPTLCEYMFHGSYPRPYHENLPTNIWYNSYIKTYLERDVRSLINVRDLSMFQLFLRFCAGQHGQEFNASQIATNLGVSQTNVMNWLSILEASYIVFRLNPYYKNYRKRLSKRSKLYFYDTAIVSHLLGIESPEHLVIHASRGAIFEGFVITEIIKSAFAEGLSPSIFYWREHGGLEIDFIIEKMGQLVGLEAKSGLTIRPMQLTGLQKLQATIDDQPLKTILVYGGDEKARVVQGTEILSWRNFVSYV